MKHGLPSSLTCWNTATVPVTFLPYKKDQTTVSKHLKVLVEAGILKYEKQGRNVIYSIKTKRSAVCYYLLESGYKTLL